MLHDLLSCNSFVDELDTNELVDGLIGCLLCQGTCSRGVVTYLTKKGRNIAHREKLYADTYGRMFPPETGYLTGKVRF